MNNFKVGDKVKAISEGIQVREREVYEIKEVRTIKGIGGKCYIIDLLVEKENDYEFWAIPDKFEKVEEK